MVFHKTNYNTSIVNKSHLTLGECSVPIIIKAMYYAHLMTFIMFQYGIVRFIFGIHIVCQNKPDFFDESFIFAANHTSHLDTVAILLSLPNSVRQRVAVAAAKDLFFAKKRYAWARWLFGLIPVDRKGGLITLRKTVSNAVASKRGVLLFPEGTRSRDGQIQKFKPGIGYVSAILDLSVIPICVSGSFQLMKHNRHFPCRGTVTVRFGDPIKSAGKGPEEFTNQIENAVRSLQKINSV